MVTRVPRAAVSGETVTLPPGSVPGAVMSYLGPETVPPEPEPPPGLSLSPGSPLSFFHPAVTVTSPAGIRKEVVRAEASSSTAPRAVQPVKA